jgi:hypothetical protein
MEGGSFGMICSNKFMRANYGRPLRSLIATRTTLIQIVDFGELPVFEKAATFPAIILTQNIKPKKQKFIYAAIKRLDFQSLEKEVKNIGNALDERSLSGDNWTLAKTQEIAIFEKMKKRGIPLGEYVKGKIYRGVLTGLNEAFVIDRATRNRLIREDKRSAEIIKPFIVGDDIRKYHINFNERYLIFARHGIQIHEFPAIERHLSNLKDRLMPRPKDWRGMQWAGRKPGPYKWYEIQDTINYYEEFEKPKIIYPVIAKESRFAFDEDGRYSNDKTFIIPLDDKYLLGLLNSLLCWGYLRRLCSVLGDPDKKGRLELRAIFLENLPIVPVNLSNPIEKDHHKRIVKLVDSMLSLHKQLSEAKSAAQKEVIQRQINATDAEIDRLVYELYGLTDDEIKIVEEGTK